MFFAAKHREKKSDNSRSQFSIFNFVFLWVVKLISLEGKDIVKKPHSCHNSNLNGLLKGQQLKVFTSRAFLQKMSHYSFKALTTRDAIWFIPQSNLGGLLLTELAFV